MKSLSKEEWFSRLENLSILFQRHGSFLPEQRDLLERVYEKLTKSKKSVWVFAAPPASGKTHAICLLARILHEADQRTAIVVPNDYLKEEFQEARSEVLGGLPNVDILNISEYLKTKKQYDFLLADEAHNLKSFLELDASVVRSIDITKEDYLYQELASRYLPPKREFVAQQLSFPSAKNLLDSLNQVSRFRRRLRPVTKNPTFWSCFIYIWKDPGQCNLKFVRADSVCRLKLPNKHLLMFSASPLSNKELNFYCGIPMSTIERASPVKSTAKWREKQILYISVADKLSLDTKIDLIMSLIQESKTRTLLLFNRFSSCKNAFIKLRKNFKNIFMIPHQSAHRLDIYKDFLSCPIGVLLTSSTVFWEGITIKGLRFLIIVEPPFPRPRLMELVKRKVINGQLDVARRLQQGLRRIGRKKGEWGVGVTLFDINTLGRYAKRVMPTNGKFFRVRAWQCLLLLHKIFVDAKTLESL